MIDADPAINGYHQSHIDLMVRGLNVVLTAINEAGYSIVDTYDLAVGNTSLSCHGLETIRAITTGETGQ